MEVRGRLFDGVSSSQKAAVLRRAGPDFELVVDGDRRVFTRDGVVIRERLGNLPRVIEFPGGWRFETDDHEGIDQHFARVTGLSLVHWLENNVQAVLIATVAFIGFCIFCYVVVLPIAAKKIAFKLPPSWIEWVSGQAWKVIGDEFDPSELKDAERERAEKVFARIQERFPGYRLKLELRHAKGPRSVNAFALPDGRLVVLDGLTELLTDENELFGVLLHEMGHVVYRHGLQSLVQGAAVSGFLLFVTGGADWSSVAGFLIAQRYSRDHEREADYYAAQELMRDKLNPSLLADALERMQRKLRDKDMKIPDFLSSHPITDERVKYLRAYMPGTEAVEVKVEESEEVKELEKDSDTSTSTSSDTDSSTDN